MIMPPDHARALVARRRVSTREKWILGAVSGVLAALILIIAISLGVTGHRTGNGCVDVSLPSTTGGAELYRCGAGARALCSAVGVTGGYRGDAARAVATQCAKAGLAVG